MINENEVVRVLLSISLQRASLKRGYSDRFFNNKQCQSMSSFVSSPASEFGLIFFIAGWFLDLEKDANLFIHRSQPRQGILET